MPYHNVVKALYSYQAQDDDELTFNEDELLIILPDNEEVESWLMARPFKSGDRFGLIPDNYVEPLESIGRLIAQFDYTAQEDNEVTFSENEILDLLAKMDDDWWLVETKSGEFGLIPSNYVKEEGIMGSPIEKNIFDKIIVEEGRKRLKEVYPNEKVKVKWSAELERGKDSCKGKVVLLGNGQILFVTGKAKEIEFSYPLSSINKYDISNGLLILSSGESHKLELSKKDSIALSDLIKESKPILPGPVAINSNDYKEGPPIANENHKIMWADYDYQAQDDDELDLKEGEEVLVLNSDGQEDWWMAQNIHNQQGLVPKSYLTDTKPIEQLEGHPVEVAENYEHFKGATPEYSKMMPSEDLGATPPKDSKVISPGDSRVMSPGGSRAISSGGSRAMSPEYSGEASLKHSSPTMETTMIRPPPTAPPLPKLNQPIQKVGSELENDAYDTPKSSNIPFDNNKEIEHDDLGYESPKNCIQAPPPPPPPLPNRPASTERKVVEASRSSLLIGSQKDIFPKETRAHNEVPKEKETIANVQTIQRKKSSDGGSDGPKLSPSLISVPPQIPAPPPMPVSSQMPAPSPVPPLPSRPALNEVQTELKNSNLENPIQRVPKKGLPTSQKPFDPSVDISKARLRSTPKPNNDLKDLDKETMETKMDSLEEKPKLPKANPWASITLKKTEKSNEKSIGSNNNNNSNFGKTLPSRPEKLKSENKPTPSETRLWKDKTGKFQTEAAFVSFEKGIVQIHKLNGNKVNVPIDSFSERDREYVYRKCGMSSPKPPVSTVERRDQPASYVVRGFDWKRFTIECGLEIAKAEKIAEQCVKKGLDEIWLDNLTRDNLRATLNIGDNEALLLMQGVTKRRLLNLERLGKDKLLSQLNQTTTTPHQKRVSSPPPVEEIKSLSIMNREEPPLMHSLAPTSRVSSTRTIKDIPVLQPQNTIRSVNIPPEPIFKEFSASGRIPLENGQFAQQQTTTQYMMRRSHSNDSMRINPTMMSSNSGIGMFPFIAPSSNPIIAQPPIADIRPIQPAPMQQTHYPPQFPPGIQMSLHPQAHQVVGSGIPNHFNSSLTQNQTKIPPPINPTPQLVDNDKYSVFKTVDPKSPSFINQRTGQSQL